jgi:uncharacterized RDD family membrane protein YckC
VSAIDERPAARPRRKPPQTIPAEARAFQGQRAGIASRVVANSIDFGLLLATLAALYLGIAAILFLVRQESFRFPSPSAQVAFAIGSLLLLLYFTASWAGTGRTYGDVVMGLRVVNRRGARMSLPGALLRALLCVAFPIGLFWAAISRQNRSVQDLVMRTSVIYDWQVSGQAPQPSRSAPA